MKEMKSLVSVNNEPTPIEGDTTLAILLNRCGYDAKNAMFAVAVNHVFVPREQYGELRISVNDEIDIVQPISGG